MRASAGCRAEGPTSRLLAGSWAATRSLCGKACGAAPTTGSPAPACWHLPQEAEARGETSKSNTHCTLLTAGTRTRVELPAERRVGVLPGKERAGREGAKRLQHLLRRRLVVAVVRSQHLRSAHKRGQRRRSAAGQRRRCGKLVPAAARAAGAQRSIARFSVRLLHASSRGNPRT